MKRIWSCVGRLLPFLAPAVVGSLMVSCSSSTSSSSSPTPSCVGVELIVAASDYSSSVVCGAPGCSIGSGSTGTDLGGDPQLATTNGRAFFLARENDLVFEVDPSCGQPKARFSVHDLAPKDPVTGELRAANPHDAAAAPDGTVVVPLYTSGKLVFVKDGKINSKDVREGGDVLDLSPYDGDGNPQPDAVRIVNVNGSAKAFVTLERLDDTGKGKDFLLSKQASQMLRVDVATRTVERAIELAGRNPFNPMAELHGLLFMAEPGNFSAADDDLAGIERFDTATSTTALLVHEKDLGGSVSELAVTDGCGAAIIAGPQKDVNPTSLVTFDPESGRVLTTIQAPVLGPTPGYDLQALAWRDRFLYVGDRRRGANGYPIHVLERRDGCTLVDTGRIIDLPQRPVALRAAM